MATRRSKRHRESSSSSDADSDSDLDAEQDVHHVLDVTTSPDGGAGGTACVFVSGDTFPLRAELRGVGGQWQTLLERWRFPRPADRLRRLLGIASFDHDDDAGAAAGGDAAGGAAAAAIVAAPGAHTRRVTVRPATNPMIVRSTRCGNGKGVCAAYAFAGARGDARRCHRCKAPLAVGAFILGLQTTKTIHRTYGDGQRHWSKSGIATTHWSHAACFRSITKQMNADLFAAHPADPSLSVGGSPLLAPADRAFLRGMLLPAQAQAPVAVGNDDGNNDVE
jgi:hypothetical protein